MESIYNRVKIMYDESKKEFGVMDITDNVWGTVATSNDLDTALKIKRAYCDGYYDGQKAKEKELKKIKENN